MTNYFNNMFVNVLGFAVKALIVFFLSVLLLLAYNVGIFSFGRMSETITQKNINKIHLNMSKCDVVQILGRPISSTDNCIVSSDGKIEKKTIETVYSYSRSGILWDIEVYIIFREDKVTDVIMQEGDRNFYIYDSKHSNKAIDFNTYNRVIPNQ